MRKQSLGELSHIFHNGPKGERTLAVLRAYFDASYAGNSGVTAIGGYIGTDTQWAEAEREWQKALQEWGLQDFHLSELPNLIGHEKTAMCAGYFANIVRRSQLQGIAAGILNSDYDIFYGRRNSRIPISKYHLCFELALQLVGEYMIGVRNDPNDQVAVIFDDDFKPPEAARAIFEFYQKARKPPSTLLSLTVGNRKDFLGLQFADLCAGVWRQSDFLTNFDTPNANIIRDTGALGGQTNSIFWTLENLGNQGITILRTMAAGSGFRAD